jgi:hypothetical protein
MKIKIDDSESISQAEHVAGILSGTAQTTMVAAMHSVSYRVPMHVLATVDAMAAQSKKSRNAMFNLLVQVGIDEVREKLDQDVAERLTIEEARAFSLIRGETTESIEE